MAGMFNIYLLASGRELVMAALSTRRQAGEGLTQSAMSTYHTDPPTSIEPSSRSIKLLLVPGERARDPHVWNRTLAKPIKASRQAHTGVQVCRCEALLRRTIASGARADYDYDVSRAHVSTRTGTTEG